MAARSTGASRSLARERAAAERAREASRRLDEVEARLAAQGDALSRTFRLACEADRRSRRVGETSGCAMRAANKSLAKLNETRRRVDLIDESVRMLGRPKDLQGPLDELAGRVRRVEREVRFAAYDRAREVDPVDAAALVGMVVGGAAILALPWAGDSWPWLVAVVLFATAAAYAGSRMAVGPRGGRGARPRTRDAGGDEGRRG